MSWISREGALKLLGVKAQTLYAYVSRGRIAMQADPRDPRKSLYARQDIDALVQRRKKGRARGAIAGQAIAWGDPVLETSIATVRDGRLIFRGRDAVEWSAHATLEDTADLLWNSTALLSDRATKPMKFAPDADAKTRGFLYLATRASADAPMLGRGSEALCEEAASLLHGLFDAMTLQPRGGALHERLGASWRLSRRHVGVLRRALVLLCDHELNPSTFAARVAAGTGGPLAASALAGYATLSGPLHGEAAQRALTYLSECVHDDPRTVLKRWAARGEGPPAVGHPLYSGGDPRAEALLRALKPTAPIARAIDAAERASGEAANIDFAIAAITRQWALPESAPFTIFALARMVGWMAHAMEQRAASRMIRPRAAYVGPV